MGPKGEPDTKTNWSTETQLNSTMNMTAAVSSTLPVCPIPDHLFPNTVSGSVLTPICCPVAQATAESSEEWLGVSLAPGFTHTFHSLFL
jgi:hypothetical protein